MPADDVQVSEEHIAPEPLEPPSVANAGTARASGGVAADLIGRYAVLLVLVAMIVTFSVLRPETFATKGNFTTILGSQAVLTFLAMGLIVTLSAGEFDLSFGGLVGLSSAIIGALSVTHGVPLPLAVAAALFACSAVGAINGMFVVGFGVNSFIATLGMATVLNGVVTAVLGGTTLLDIPAGLTSPIRREILGVPASVFYALLLVLLVWYVFRFTPLGRRLLFTGKGVEAARLAGVRVARIRFGSFVFSALTAGLAGVVVTGTLGASDPTVGPQYLLPAFAAAFLGATTVQPGRFNVWGTIIAIYVLITGVTGLQLLGAPSWTTDVFNGAALLLAVTFAHLASRGRAGV